MKLVKIQNEWVYLNTFFSLARYLCNDKLRFDSCVSSHIASTKHLLAKTAGALIIQHASIIGHAFAISLHIQSPNYLLLSFCEQTMLGFVEVWLK